MDHKGVCLTKRREILEKIIDVRARGIRTLHTVRGTHRHFIRGRTKSRDISQWSFRHMLGEKRVSTMCRWEALHWLPEMLDIDHATRQWYRDFLKDCP